MIEDELFSIIIFENKKNALGVHVPWCHRGFIVICTTAAPYHASNCHTFSMQVIIAFI